MKQSLKRAVAVSAVCAAGLAGTLTTTTGSAVADQGSADKAAPVQKITDFGMTALAYGTKVAVGGVDIKTLKDAKYLQACTRTANRSSGPINSALSTDQITSILGDALPVDVASLIHLSPSTSQTDTYTRGAVTGTRATNTIGDIQIGGELVDNVSIPTITIKGLTSVADSFFDNTTGKYGTAETFGFDTLSLELPEDGVIGDTLNMLLNNLGLSVGDLNEVINVPLGILVDTLNQIISTAGLGDVIEIPGLGSIGLGSSFHKVGANAASSGANALQIEVNPSGEQNGAAALLKLGYAQSRIASPVKSGVFRSTIMGLDFRALPLLDDVELLHMGGIGTQAIPCEGTGGKKVTKKIEGSRSIPLNIPGLGGLATLNGIEYSYKAKQMSRGRARSVARSQLGSLEIPVLGLTIKGISSKLNLKSFPGERVRGSNKPKFKVLDILQNGESILPGNLRIGDVIEFVVDSLDQTGFITFGDVHSRNYYGSKVSAINVTIPGLFDIDLGWLESQIYPK